MKTKIEQPENEQEITNNPVKKQWQTPEFVIISSGDGINAKVLNAFEHTGSPSGSHS